MSLNLAQRSILQLTQQTLGTTKASEIRSGWSAAPNPEREARHEPLRAPQPPGATHDGPETRAGAGSSGLQRHADFWEMSRERSRELLAGMTSPNMRRAWTYLHSTAIEYAHRRGFSPYATEIVMHCPSEIAALELMIGRTTLWRYLQEWREQGLVDWRGHSTTVNGETRKDGTLYAVRLWPTRGKRARVRYEDLKHQGWRDLAGDIERGRTAHRQMKQSYRRTEESANHNRILQWALPPLQAEAPLPMTVPTPGVPATSAAMLELRHAGRAQRGSLVDTAARAIARELNDARSLNWYRHLLWQLLRLLDRGRDLLDTVHTAVLRARADHRERFARKPGALLLSRLRHSGLLEEIESVPRHRVGIAPARA